MAVEASVTNGKPENPVCKLSGNFVGMDGFMNITNGAGELIAFARAADGQDSCTFEYAISGVPTNENVYNIELDATLENLHWRLSREEIERDNWRVTLTE